MQSALLSAPAERMHDYQHTCNPVSDSGRPVPRAGFDLARDLLSDDDFKEVLHRRNNDHLYNLAVELDDPPDSSLDGADLAGNEPDKLVPSFAGIAKGGTSIAETQDH